MKKNKLESEDAKNEFTINSLWVVIIVFLLILLGVFYANYKGWIELWVQLI